MNKWQCGLVKWQKKIVMVLQLWPISEYLQLLTNQSSLLKQSWRHYFQRDTGSHIQTVSQEECFSVKKSGSLA